MLVQAVEVDYDYNNQRVSAVGNVQMFYNGTSVEPTRSSTTRRPSVFTPRATSA